MKLNASRRLHVSCLIVFVADRFLGFFQLRVGAAFRLVLTAA